MEQTEQVTARITPETDEKLQTLVDATDTTRAEVVRTALLEYMDDVTISENEEIMAKLEELQREVDEEEGERGDGGGLEEVLPGGERDPGPLGVLSRLNDE